MKCKCSKGGVQGGQPHQQRDFLFQIILYLAASSVARNGSIMGKRRTAKKRRKQHIAKASGQRLAAELRGQDLSRVLVAAIDGGKKSHKALIADGFGEIIVDTFEFSNDLAGAIRFTDEVNDASRRVDAFKVIVGLESTGHYSENLVVYLLENGFDVRQVNSMAVGREREAGLTWCKTDDIDLCAIGQLILNGKSKLLNQTTVLYDNMQYAERARRSSVRRRTLIENQIHSYMDRLFPGFLDRDIFSDPFGATSMAFMARYGSARAASRAGFSRLERWLSSRPGAREPHQKAQALVDLARGALRRPAEHEEALLQALRFRLEEHDLLVDQIKHWNVNLASYLVDTPGIWLLSIRRVNIVSAAEYMGEAGPVTQYKGANQIIAKAGFVPRETQSSSIGYTGGITKLGHSKLRYILGVIGNNLVKDNRYFQSFYRRLVDVRGKDERLAKIAVSCKFVRVSWAMMKLKSAFEAPTWCGDDLQNDIRKKMISFLTESGASQQYQKSIGPRLDKVLGPGGRATSSAGRRRARRKQHASGTQRNQDGSSAEPISVGSLIPAVLEQMAAAQTEEVDQM